MTENWKAEWRRIRARPLPKRFGVGGAYAMVAGRSLAALPPFPAPPESLFPLELAAPRPRLPKTKHGDRRFKAAREAMHNLAELHGMPVENLLTPDYLRRLMWEPPATRDPASLAEAVRAQLAHLGARQWQVDQVAGALTGAILAADAG